ncbi:MAG: hypothetical protein WC686_01975 [Candidatus Shapirobacteria bacterium]
MTTRSTKVEILSGIIEYLKRIETSTTLDDLYATLALISATLPQIRPNRPKHPSINRTPNQKATRQ